MITMKEVINATCGNEDEQKLFKAVMRQIGDWKNVFEYPEDYRDASAGVSGFIYYSDTEKFAGKNTAIIMSVLSEFQQEIGEPLKIDSDNPMNWLAWFALEHIIDKVIQFKESNHYSLSLEVNNG